MVGTKSGKMRLSKTTSSTRSRSTHSPAMQSRKTLSAVVAVAVAAVAAHPVVEHEKHKVPRPATVSNKATFLDYRWSSTQNSFQDN